MSDDHVMSFGANLVDGGVRFRLWAPAQESVTLVIESTPGERCLPMSAQDDGWFELTTDAAKPGDRYRYQFADGMRVPDPASRFQPDDVHGASEIIDPQAYAWRETQWRGRPWRETVLYEAHVGTFTPSGDYDGMCRKLDHLVELGVTALELMPLADVEGRRNWGYDGVLMFAPDAGYGRPEALKHLIDAAHARGLMMFLDVVYNHFGPSGNYLETYAPQFLTDRYHTPWGDVIDFGYAPVRQFFIDNALYWLGEYRFDGLRLDAVDHIQDDSSPHILTELATTVRSRISDRHIHLVLENGDNAAHYLARQDQPPSTTQYNAQWNDDFHHAAHVLATGERGGYYVDYCREPETALACGLAEGFIYQGQYSSYHEHDRGEPGGALPPTAFVSFLQNHDQVGNRAFGERLAELSSPEALATLTAIWLLAPAVPLLFMGQEWASRQPFHYFCDYHEELAQAVREGRRQEFVKFAHFADPASHGRIPDPNAETTFAASVLDWSAAQTAEGKQRRELIGKLLAIRREYIQPHLGDALHGGSYTMAGRALRVEWPLADGVRLHLIANPTSTPAHGLNWPLPGQRLYAQPHDFTEDVIGDLPPWSVLWSLA